MPIYEYKCEVCGEEFERLVFAGDEEKGITCPKCGAAGARRLLSAFATGERSPLAGLSAGGSCGGSGGFS